MPFLVNPACFLRDISQVTATQTFKSYDRIFHFAGFSLQVLICRQSWQFANCNSRRFLNASQSFLFIDIITSPPSNFGFRPLEIFCRALYSVLDIFPNFQIKRHKTFKVIALACDNKCLAAVQTLVRDFLIV